RVPVAMAYRPGPEEAGDGTAFGFDLGPYDPAHPLLLDPAVLVYCGFVGGSRGDEGLGVAVDAAGNAYVTGCAESTEQTFPVTVGPHLTFHGGPTPFPGDAFVAKVNAAGTALLYCGYLGGADLDRGCGIAVDAAGSAYIVGDTASTEQTFPVVLGPDLTYNGLGDVFVAKVASDGKSLVYCGYVGGSRMDHGHGIAVDAAGHAYLTGETTSTEQSFPVVVGPDLTYNGGSSQTTDAFVAKVSPQGTGLVYCGYIGGGSYDVGLGIAVDAAGQAYATGGTCSTEGTFPVTVGPDLTHNGGVQDAFVAKVNAAGTALLYCGYLGGSDGDAGRGIAVDAAGNAYLVGDTGSTEQTFPVVAGPDLTFNGSLSDAFVACVNRQGTGLVYCGYLGGDLLDWGRGIAVDGAGNACVTGYTVSTEQTFPVMVGPDLTYNGNPCDAFVAKVNPQGTGLVYCGYVGGTGTDSGWGIAVDAAGNAYLAGSTQSDQQTFPVTVGPDLTYNGGASDAFVAKIALTLLAAAGTMIPGGQVNLALSASGDAGLPYQMGTSLGTGPIPIDTRRIALSPDGLLVVTVNHGWPSIFSGYRGMISATGQAQAAIHIPALAALIGVRLHTAFVTLHAAAPSGIKSISNTFSFSITK
ncbi:MAG: SBBP repeat-containing protein, partial [Polyangiaceae bacterium]|nr:SBBP repeat-containing protein [Polyangiaceae bacterium]